MSSQDNNVTSDAGDCGGNVEAADRVCELQVEIKNADGLHMRPAMQFVDMASTFDCDIEVSSGSTTVDGKSIMQISMLAATRGTVLRISARGQDAGKAVAALKSLVEDVKFQESAGAGH
jgi:phosphocarrier protein